MYQVVSPVLFLFFNRQNESKVVFEEIKKSKPSKLFLASDGPRDSRPDEKALVLEIRNYILNNIDWQCEVKTLFRDNNLGCKKAVSEAITWFFNTVDEGIIIEDDCLPSSDFFRFCDNNLKEYRDDHRIGHICGCNFQDGIKRGSDDYYFSKLVHVWGWASWRRVWNQYDVNLSAFAKAYNDDILSCLTDKSYIKNVLYESFLATKGGLINTWDYQYFFTNLTNGSFSIIPNYNLISNIGFNSSGTHTNNQDSKFANIKHDILPESISKPNYIYQNRAADDYTLTKEMKAIIGSPILYMIKKRIKSYLILFGFYKKN